MVYFKCNGRSGEWACDRWITVEHRAGRFEGWVMEHLCDEYMPEAVWYFSAQSAEEALKEVRELQEAYNS